MPGTCITSLSSPKVPWVKYQYYPTYKRIACSIENSGNLTPTYPSSCALNFGSLTSKPMCWTVSLYHNFRCVMLRTWFKAFPFLSLCLSSLVPPTLLLAGDLQLRLQGTPSTLRASSHHYPLTSTFPFNVVSLGSFPWLQVPGTPGSESSSMVLTFPAWANLCLSIKRTPCWIILEFFFISKISIVYD